MDGLTVKCLRRMGYKMAFPLFNKWINGSLDKYDLTLLSTARLIMLSKIKNQITVELDDIRYIAVQPLMIRILE